MTDDLPRLIDPESVGSGLPPGVRLVHVAESAAYQQAHIPGALLVEPRELVGGQPPAPGRLPSVPRLEQLFGRLGYQPGDHFLVYDDEGGGWAGRFIWTLDVIGHDRWSYLDGGLHAWHAARMPLTGGAPDPVRASAVSIEAHGGPLADLDDVMKAMADPDQLIWDVRSAEEYRGERSGARRAGHIPGARHLDWMQLKDPARAWRLRSDLPALLAAHGIDPARRVITHCQTHHRSGLSYLVGCLLDFRDIRAYHGSWAEWGNRDDTPVATGAEPGGRDDA